MTKINKLSFLFGSIFLSLILVFMVSFLSKECTLCNKCKETDLQTSIKSSPSNKYFDIKGAIKKSGVYEFQDGETINDAIIKAGGKEKNAYTKNLNLSKKLTDEMVIYVFSKSEISNLKRNCDCDIESKLSCEENKQNEKENVIGDDISVSLEGFESNISDSMYQNSSLDVAESEKTTILDSEENIEKKISINSATVDILTKVYGIGETKAKAIIEYRETNGPFTKLEELLNVKGIGIKIYEKIKDYLEL